jgi:hypothetical protein
MMWRAAARGADDDARVDKEAEQGGGLEARFPVLSWRSGRRRVMLERYAKILDANEKAGSHLPSYLNSKSKPSFLIVCPTERLWRDHRDQELAETQEKAIPKLRSRS